MRWAALAAAAAGVCSATGSSEARLPLAPDGTPCDGDAPPSGRQPQDCAPPPLLAGKEVIACVGDSITYGSHASSAAKSYPSQLQVLLEDKYPGRYDVHNYGASGATLQKQGDSPYWKRPQYKAAMASNASVVIIMLGTNDAKDKSDGGPANWENDGKTGENQYVADYHSLIGEFKQFATQPVIYTAIPPPLYKPGVYGMNQTVINTLFPVLIPQVNAANGLPHHSIDIFDDLGGAKLSHPEWSSDGCHPNDAGYLKLAQGMQKGIGL